MKEKGAYFSNDDHDCVVDGRHRQRERGREREREIAISLFIPEP